RDGLQILFPVLAGTTLLGCLEYNAHRPAFNQRDVQHVWTEVRKFGEQLYQAKLFEQASFDPESTLRNGVSFYNDLNHEFSLAPALRSWRALVLIQSIGRTTLSEMPVLGPLLTECFDGPQFRLYRIAGDAVAILGRTIGEQELEQRLAAFLERSGEHAPADVAAGYADLVSQTRSPQHWFDCAGEALT